MQNLNVDFLFGGCCYKKLLLTSTTVSAIESALLVNLMKNRSLAEILETL